MRKTENLRSKPEDEVRESFLDVMRYYPQGVSILTAKVDGKNWGMTVSSFISLSINPPLVLISIMKNTDTYKAIIRADHFSLSVLSDKQAEIAERFASDEENRFRGVRIIEGRTGSSLIEGALSYVECKKEKEIDVWDHTILIGRVLHAYRASDALPLVYFRRRYTTLLNKEEV